MQDSLARTVTGSGTSGVFNYLDAKTRPSLFRNGEVLTRRNADGSDFGFRGVNLEPQELTVADARVIKDRERPTLAANGFELLESPLDGVEVDFFAHDEVVHRYYPRCAAIVAAMVGAEAFAFDHNVRSASGKQSGKRIAGGQQVQGPAHLVHGDYTLTSAPQRLRELTRPPDGNDTLRKLLGTERALIEAGRAERALEGGRFAIVNVWRNIAHEPVATHPIAFCDGRSVEPEDLVVFEIHYQNRIGENYFARYSPRHRWYYYPAATREEALLIKQWDSAGRLARSRGAEGDASDPTAPCTFSFHSAFEDPATSPDAPDRWSIEVRCVVLYD
jgi:hypothetical protein